jgi:hypothetical protein
MNITGWICYAGMPSSVVVDDEMRPFVWSRGLIQGAGKSDAKNWSASIAKMTSKALCEHGSAPPGEVLDKTPHGSAHDKHQEQGKPSRHA